MMQRMIFTAAAVIGMASGTVDAADWIQPSEKGAGFWDVDFSGGSLSEYYAGLGATVEDLSIVVHPDATRVAMPALKLQKIHARSLVEMPMDLLTGIEIDESAGAHGATETGDREQAVWIVRVDPGEVTSWVQQRVRPTHDPGYDISFPGGSVQQYIELVRSVSDGGMNVVLMPGVEGVQVPEIALKGVFPSQALAVLNELRRPDGQPWARVGEVATNVFVLRPESDDRLETTREVWNLSELMSNGVGEDGILRAVEMGLGSVGDGADVLYHEDTGLLLVVGTHDHVHVVDEILDEMHKTASVREHQRIMLEERLREREELQLDIYRHQAKLELLQQQVAMQKDALREQMNLEEQGVVASHEVRHSQMMLQEYEAELHIKVREVQMLERRYKALEAGQDDRSEGGSGAVGIGA